MKATALLLGLLAALVAFSACAGGSVAHLAAAGRPRMEGLGEHKSLVGAPKLEGRLAYSRDGAIWVLDGGSESRLTEPPEGTEDIQPAWSADGTKLAFVRRSEAYSDIYVLDLADMSETALTNNKSDYPERSLLFVQYCNWAFRPAWSPDGTEIAYLSDVYTYDTALWLISASGEGARQISRLQDAVGGLDKPEWTPDGESILTASFAGGSQQIWTVNLATGEWAQLVTEKGAAYDPALSPDASRLAYTARTEGRHDVWVVDLETGETLQVSDFGRSRAPAWSPDGDQIAYLAESENSFDIWVATLPAASNGDGVEQYRATNGLRIDANSGLSWTR